MPEHTRAAEELRQGSWKQRKRRNSPVLIDHVVSLFYHVTGTGTDKSTPISNYPL